MNPTNHQIKEIQNTARDSGIAIGMVIVIVPVILALIYFALNYEICQSV